MSDTIATPQEQQIPFCESRKVMRLFMISLIVYILLCAYLLIFSGSLFFEAIIKGWYKSTATEFDRYSFWLGYLYGFPSICGVIGGLSVISTGWKRYYRIKVLLFIPAAIWSTQLVLGNFRWGFTYWTQWLYLVPVMSLSIFVLFCAIKKVSVPVLSLRSRRKLPDQPTQNEL